jgi:hypothetical protein
MSDRESVINHLKIIHTWAEFARERDLQFFTAKHLEDIAQWSVDALNLLKEQEEQKQKWLQTIADTQLAISPTGYESEDELAKRGWEWNGLQIAWEIIAGEERSEHTRLVRCKDCAHGSLWCGNIKCVKPGMKKYEMDLHPVNWFCADGERRTDDA